MSTGLIFGLIGGLLVLAFLANRMSRLTRIPDVLMLMALGVMIGPGLHLADPASLTGATNLRGTLAIILVLFEGGAAATHATVEAAKGLGDLEVPALARRRRQVA